MTSPNFLTQPRNSNPADAAIPLGYPGVTPLRSSVGRLPAATPDQPAQQGARPPVHFPNGQSVQSPSLSPSTSSQLPNPQLPGALPPVRYDQAVGRSTSQPPLPNRPRGRVFIATILFLIGAAFSYFIFESFVRYGAYGQITGRKLHLATPWDGIVSDLRVRVGDRVRQGDVLFRVENLAMRHRVDEIKGELDLERAKLTAQISRLKWEAERVKDEDELVKADYYEKWSELLWEQAILTDLEQQVQRAIKLKKHDAFAEEKFKSLTSKLVGQEQRIAALSHAVGSLKDRTINDQSSDAAVDDQVQPTLVRIENLQAELERTRQVLAQGEVRCPINARVARIKRLSGEHALAAENIVELMVEGTVEIVLFVPQKKIDHWVAGDQIDVMVQPYQSPIRCEIKHFGPEMQPAPPSIMRHYAADEALLPVVMRPLDPRHTDQMVIGSTVRLPRIALSSKRKQASNSSAQP